MRQVQCMSPTLSGFLQWQSFVVGVFNGRTKWRKPRALGLFDLMHVFAARAKLLNWVRLFLYCEALLMDIWAYVHSQSWLKGSRWQFPPQKSSLFQKGIPSIVSLMSHRNRFPSSLSSSIFTQFPNILTFHFTPVLRQTSNWVRRSWTSSQFSRRHRQMTHRRRRRFYRIFVAFLGHDAAYKWPWFGQNWTKTERAKWTRNTCFYVYPHFLLTWKMKCAKYEPKSQKCI